MNELLIGKIGFGKDEFYYGLELCLAIAGMTAHVATPLTAKGFDVLLVTLFWYRDVYNLELFLRKSKIKKGQYPDGPLIMAGGIHCVMNPILVAEMVDYVFIGDADDCLGDILTQVKNGKLPENNHLYKADDENIPIPRVCPPTAFAMQKGGSRGVLRCEIARGCKYKCAFCAISKLKPYNEVDTNKIINIIKHSKEKTISLFAPERTLHSGWRQIKETMKHCGKHDLGQDVRLEHILEVPGNTATIGIEGISYRLRRSIHKAFKKEYILSKFAEFIESRNRVCMISAYFIADLPGEEEVDWGELFDLFESIEKEHFSRFLVLKPVLNPLSPRPFTELASAEIHPFVDYKKKWSNILRKNGGQWGFRCVESMVWGPFERVMDSLATWGGKEAYRIIRKMDAKILNYHVNSDERGVMAVQLIVEARQNGISENQLFGPREGLENERSTEAKTRITFENGD